ncbi:hypothetical protein PHMEG_00031351 [Phytophthora megakarya]|uniref:Uncharacterized protein n=1 Tax=Phytophthora megakarya TaxID=4795 RepID=A0A225UZ25_9STRA|nr:hypothetical protein PHMEG_00031351 [Phytophthora megakarya]
MAGRMTSLRMTTTIPTTIPETVRATGKGTIMFNPMDNITALEDFDNKQPLAVRTRWLEKFQSLSVMGRWSGYAKVYYYKLKLSSAG